ncbi:MAG: N-acetylmuramoyl-L-alanine amidase [Alphaproteobacteria bacterium]
MFGFRLWTGLLLLFMAVLGQAGNASAAAGVTGVRIGEHPGSTRFVLDLTDDVEFQVFALPDPYRIVVDLPEMKWDIPQGVDGRGLVAKYRFGLFTPGTSRLVLDLTEPAIARRSFLLRPQGPFGYRLVLDLQATTRAAFVEMAKGTAPKATPPPSPADVVSAPIRRADGKRVIVVDAGHGGVDPGTISKDGTYEKTVTLRAAKTLKRHLDNTGRFHVVLTRSRDIFIPLRERVEIGRRAGADLFISLHADAIHKRHIRGATVYTLSETASDKEAAALARKENQADVIAGVDLDGESELLKEILIDLMQRETMNYSADFAGVLIPKMRQSVLMRTNSHRFAGFRVLKAPDVPSVLVEMGYLSNAEDARFLRSQAGIEKIARAISTAVGVYFDQRDAFLTSP